MPRLFEPWPAFFFFFFSLSGLVEVPRQAFESGAAAPAPPASVSVWSFTRRVLFPSYPFPSGHARTHTPLSRCGVSIMIHPKVHLRIPCYDFYSLFQAELARLLGTPRERPPKQPSQGTNPKRSFSMTIGSSDGRCVQRAGTQSTRAADSRLLGIPGSWGTIAGPNPYYEWGSTGFPALSS